MSNVQRPDKRSQIVNTDLHDFLDGDDIVTAEDLMFEGTKVRK